MKIFDIKTFHKISELERDANLNLFIYLLLYSDAPVE